MSHLNYPEGSDNQFAPWNAPDTERAEIEGRRHVCGANLNLTLETLGEFIATVDESREHLLVKSMHLLGPISTAEIITLWLEKDLPDAFLAAAMRELKARYLDADYTKRVIDSEVDSVIEAGWPV